jgi:hypothetical protein
MTAVFRVTCGFATFVARQFNLVDPGGYGAGYRMFFDLAKGGGGCRLS